jgi:Ferritin-like domain
VVSDEEAASSRRQLLGAAAAATLAAAEFATACGSSSSHPHVGKVPPAAGQTDVDYLNRALELKQYAVAAYTAATPLLRGREHAAAKRFLGQDLAHASQLMSLIKHAGGIPNPPRASYDLGHPRGTRGLMNLLTGAENQIIAGFLQLVPKVSPGVVRAELCAILANDAQHVAILRLELHRDPIPAAFVTGRE